LVNDLGFSYESPVLVEELLREKNLQDSAKFVKHDSLSVLSAVYKKYFGNKIYVFDCKTEYQKDHKNIKQSIQTIFWVELNQAFHHRFELGPGDFHKKIDGIAHILTVSETARDEVNVLLLKISGTDGFNLIAHENNLFIFINNYCLDFYRIAALLTDVTELLKLL
jgi:hypothetical protein